MAGNTTATVQSNQTFTTGVVSLATGVLNPANSAQSVWDCGVGMTYASITTVVTGSPASFTILLEGTYDGTNWTTLATCTNTAGETQYATGLIAFTNLRARCTAVTGGTSPTVNVFATAAQTPFTATSGGTSPSTPVSPISVAAANVLCGSAAATNSAAAQTIITVPAGRTWYGTVSAFIAATAGTALVSATINTAGTNVTPAAAVNLLTVTSDPVTAAGQTAAGLTTGPFYVIAPVGNSVTLTLTNSSATTNQSTASALGILL